MQTFAIEARLTYHYRTGWSHLDNHVPVTTLKLTEPVVIGSDDDGGYSTRQHGRLTAKQLAEAKAVWKQRPKEDRTRSFRRWLEHAIAGNFASGCCCEHDCCGHYQSFSDVKVTGRRVAVQAYYYRNI